MDIVSGEPRFIIKDVLLIGAGLVLLKHNLRRTLVLRRVSRAQSLNATRK